MILTSNEKKQSIALNNIILKMMSKQKRQVTEKHTIMIPSINVKNGETQTIYPSGKIMKKSKEILL